MTIGLRKRSLLIVEDAQPMQQLLREMGISASFDVTAAASRSEAMEAIERRRFELALVDMRLIEWDKNNKDGLSILQRLFELGEGTVSAILTVYGTFGDAEIARERYGAHIVEKGVPHFSESVGRLLRLASEAQFAPRVEPSYAWSGREHPDLWSFQLNSVLRPKGDFGVTLSLLQELLLTCDPILEGIDAHGLEPIPDHPAVAGLYWSRGIGEAVVVVASREALPSTIPVPLHWPNIVVQDVLYRTSKKNLCGAIVRCSGARPEDFPIKRSDLD